MFKKKFKISTQNLVSSKDKKYFMKIWKLIYSEEQLNRLITKNSEIRQDKITSSKDSIYTLISANESGVSETPIFICHESKGKVHEIYPTVYSLLRVPFLITTIFYLKSGVESFITNGANLMWPGVDRIEKLTLSAISSTQDTEAEGEGDEDAKTQEKQAKERKANKLNKFQTKAYENIKSSLVAIFYKRKLVDGVVEIPLAIGKLANEESDTEQDIKIERKGVAVEIIHYFLDELWNYGDQQNIIPEDWLNKNAKVNDNDEEIKQEVDVDEATNNDNLPQEEAPKDENIGGTTTEEVENSKTEIEQNNDASETHQENLKEEVDDEDQIEESKANDISPDLMDDLIIRNFIMWIVRHIKDEQLPMEPSSLQSEYMFRYEHKTLGKVDFKKSNYRKITKFLKNMQKLKFIKFTKLKDKNHEVLTEIDRKAIEKAEIDISNFKKVIQTTEDKKEEIEEVKGNPNKTYPCVEIEETFKIHSKDLSIIWEFVQKNSESEFFSINDIREIISEYINQNNLNHNSQKNHVYLDPHLAKLIPNQNDIKKDGNNSKPIVNKGIIYKNIELFMKPYHIVTLLNVAAKKVQSVKPGPIPKVKIIIEKFRNKNITRVLGLETWEIDFKDACKVFQNKLAVGVSISEKVKSYTTTHIRIQGLHHERVENILINDFAIKRKHIDHINMMSGGK